MQIKVDEDEIPGIDTTMKKRDVRGMRINGHALLNDENFETTNAKNTNSRNDFSISKR